MARELRTVLTGILFLFVLSNAQDVNLKDDVSDAGACDCGPNSSGCIFGGDQKVCYCDDGYAQRNFTAEGNCEKCSSCGPYGKKCEFRDGVQRCICDQGVNKLTGECLKPRNCSCGEHGSCSFKNGIRVCHCDQGYAENWGRCEECDCGEGKCEFAFGEKKCDCKKDFIQVNGKCQECDCGPNSIYCKRGYNVFSNKICTCKEGYAVYKQSEVSDQSCKKCECGKNGISCTIKYTLFRDEQTCECKYGSFLKTEKAGQKCKECDCGPSSLSCRFNGQGDRICDCKEGSKSRKETGSYWGDEYCTTLTEDEEDGGSVPGWKIAIYVLAAVLGITIISFLAVIVIKKMNRRTLP